MAGMVDRLDDGVGASRQGRHDGEHQGEAAHVVTIDSRDRAGHHTRARSRPPRGARRPARSISLPPFLRRLAKGVVDQPLPFDQDRRAPLEDRDVIFAFIALTAFAVILALLLTGDEPNAQ